MAKNIFTTLRKKEKLTQPQMAEKLGVSNAYISQLENNERTPSLPMYKKIEKLLGEDIKPHFF